MVRKILIAESADFSPKALQILEEIGEVVTADLHRKELIASLSGVEVLWIRLRNRIDEELLRAAPGLKMIVSPTTGLNHIDLEAAHKLGITVLSLRGKVDFLKEIRATAELTVGLLLSLLRNIPRAVDHVNAGGWNRDDFKGAEISGKTVGIIGYGRLGRIVATYLEAFGAKVIAADPLLRPGPDASGVEIVTLEELLTTSDIITVHVNLTDRTVGLLGAEQFARMKKGAWLINTSRGEIIQESALLQALESGSLAGAALDVLADERPTGMRNHPLVGYARKGGSLLITPHIGGCTAESMAKTEEFLAEKVREILVSTEPHVS